MTRAWAAISSETKWTAVVLLIVAVVLWAVVGEM